jgi:hypothetical protein
MSKYQVSKEVPRMNFFLKKSRKEIKLLHNNHKQRTENFDQTYPDVQTPRQNKGFLISKSCWKL